MKVQRTTQGILTFEPIEITITVESEGEKEALFELAKTYLSVPRAVKNNSGCSDVVEPIKNFPNLLKMSLLDN